MIKDCKTVLTDDRAPSTGPPGGKIVHQMTNQDEQRGEASNVRPIFDHCRTLIHVKYQKYKLKALLDSGIQVTITGRDVSERCGWEIRGYPTKSVSCANGEQMIIDGVAIVPLKIGGEMFET